MSILQCIWQEVVVTHKTQNKQQKYGWDTLAGLITKINCKLKQMVEVKIWFDLIWGQEGGVTRIVSGGKV